MTKKSILLAGAVSLAMGVASSSVDARSGKASYYTRSGAMITAANEPVGSILRATNPQNGKSITVRVVGSGPFVPGRVLDFSTGAFTALYGSTSRGVGPVRYTIIRRGNGLSSRTGSGRNRSKRSRRTRRR